MAETTPVVGVVMGSDSDLSVMAAAGDVLERFSVPYEIRVLSAHRRPFDMLDYGKTARERGLRVIIAGAGGAAHLPGMLASATTLPVIGVPVATVAIGNATNAGLLAVRILANDDEGLGKALADYAQEIAADSAEADDRLQATRSDFGFH